MRTGRETRRTWGLVDRKFVFIQQDFVCLCEVNNKKPNKKNEGKGDFISPPIHFVPWSSKLRISHSNSVRWTLTLEENTFFFLFVFLPC